jgi:hypothetical protein
MISKLSPIVLVLIILAVFSCDRKNDHQDDKHAGSSSEWKEMDAFHSVMAEAFHPYKDSSDLKPARENAEELSTAAKEWKSSDIPDGLDNDKIESKLNQLVNLSEKFEEEVKAGDDAVIANSLVQLHDLFHDLQNDFYAAGSKGHDDHEHHDH